MIARRSLGGGDLEMRFLIIAFRLDDVVADIELENESVRPSDKL